MSRQCRVPEGRRRAFRPFLESLEDRVTPANLPGGFAETVLASGLAVPTAMELAPDGRLFVAEQTGDLMVIKNGALLPQPFVHLNVDFSGERGLLGIAFDPNFEANGFVYLYHTVPASGSTPAFNEISRFTAAGDVAAPGSQVDVFQLPALGPSNHNGGAIHFGPDGKLYVGVGENGTPSNSQSLNTPLGKLLRINPDGSIPTDNPFYNVTTGINRAIWALGLRNPFTFAIQPGTGTIFINDVGQSTWEEIDLGVPGANYGWPITEGPFNPADPQFAGLTPPIFFYGHGAGDSLGAAITGGTFYDPATGQFPTDFTGTYFFSDFGNGWIRDFNPATGVVSVFADGIDMPVDLKVDPSGNLYYLAHGNGSANGYVARVSFTGTPNQRYVAALFGDLLDRAADPAGLAAWSGLLDRGVPRSFVVQALENSLEHRTVVVAGLFQRILQRNPDPGGLQAGLNFLAAGGTDQELAAILYGSPEYFALQGGTNAGFVQGLFQSVLGHPANATGLQGLSGELTAGLPRQALAQAVLASSEAEQVVTERLYQQYLHVLGDPTIGAALLQQTLSEDFLTSVLLSSDQYFNEE